MPKKKQQPVYLPIYTDAEGKQTFNAYRFQEVEKDGEKKLEVVRNEMAKNEDGTLFIKPMNRAARRATKQYREQRKLLRK